MGRFEKGNPGGPGRPKGYTPVNELNEFMHMVLKVWHADELGETRVKDLLDKNPDLVFKAITAWCQKNQLTTIDIGGSLDVAVADRAELERRIAERFTSLGLGPGGAGKPEENPSD